MIPQGDVPAKQTVGQRSLIFQQKIATPLASKREKDEGEITD